MAVEWQRLQSETCGGCGHLLSESLDEGNSYEPSHVTCFACQVKERADRAAAERENADTAGRKSFVKWAGRRPVIDDN